MLHLQILSGPQKGEKVSLYDERLPLTIGRDSDNKLCLRSAAISRFHAVIFSEEGIYYVEDLKSTNGTYLNGMKIKKAKIGPGDELAIANINISIEASTTIPFEPILPLNLAATIEKPLAPDKTLRVTQLTDDIVLEEQLSATAQLNLMQSHDALRSLYRTDDVLRDIDDLNRMLERFTALVVEVIPCSRAYVFLLGEESSSLILYVRKAPHELIPKTEIIISQTVIDKTIKNRETILARNALISEVPSDKGKKPKVTGAMCSPFISRNKVLGIIYIDTWSKQNGFCMDELSLLFALSTKAATAIENAKLYENLRNLFYNTVETLIRTMQAKDKYTSGHSTRVSRFSLLIADKIGLSSREKHQLYLAAVLHDIGKIGLPDKLLLRPGKLTKEEMDRVKEHPSLGVSMIKSLGEMQSIIPLILHHHEAFDGSGYPDGLKGEQIPLMSRIVAVADTYDAIISDRPYRKGRSQEEAIRELKRVAGIKLDPNIVKAFLEVLEEISPQRKLAASLTEQTI